MSKYATSPAPVNIQLEETLAEFNQAYKKLSDLVERLHTAAAPYVATDLERRHSDPLEPLRVALQRTVGPRIALMAKYEPRERECDTCGQTAICDYEDCFDVSNPNMICAPCEATLRGRPYAQLTDQVEQ